MRRVLILSLALSFGNLGAAFPGAPLDINQIDNQIETLGDQEPILKTHLIFQSEVFFGRVVARGSCGTLRLRAQARVLAGRLAALENPLLRRFQLG